jgi:hypothetical protein
LVSCRTTFRLKAGFLLRDIYTPKFTVVGLQRFCTGIVPDLFPIFKTFILWIKKTVKPRLGLVPHLKPDSPLEVFLASPCAAVILNIKKHYPQIFLFNLWNRRSLWMNKSHTENCCCAGWNPSFIFNSGKIEMLNNKHPRGTHAQNQSC